MPTVLNPIPIDGKYPLPMPSHSMRGGRGYSRGGSRGFNDRRGGFRGMANE
jgi:hypothetical protein